MADERQIVGAVATRYKKKELAGCVDDARASRATVKDPINLGWVYYYEYKCLYELARYQEAFDLFKEVSGSKQSMVVFTLNNGIWMHSVAMELAFRLKDRQAVVDIAAKALELAKSQPDRVKMLEENRKKMLDQLT